MAILNSAQLNSYIQNKAGEKVSVTSISNTQRTNKVDTDIIVEKQVQKNWAIPKDEILVTTVITNNADVNLENFHFKDTLSAGASFVAGSVMVGSMAHDELDPIAGFDLQVTIGALGGECEISYKILVDEYPEVDDITVSTTINVSLDNKQFDLTSNTASIAMLNNEVYLLKTASTTAVKSGDEIVYTIEITNNGTIDNTDLYFEDKIPSGTQFVENSVKVNGTEKTVVDPETGFALDDLPAQGKITVEFTVKVL